MGLFDSFQEVYALPRGTMEEEKGRGRKWGPLGGKDRAKRSVGWRADGQSKGREADEEQEEAEHSREQLQRGRIGGVPQACFRHRLRGAREKMRLFLIPFLKEGSPGRERPGSCMEM